jgi:hypothetical protein
MKTEDRPFADPEKAARRLMQHAHAFEIVQDGRIYIEKINGPFLYVDRGTPRSSLIALVPDWPRSRRKKGPQR